MSEYADSIDVPVTDGTPQTPDMIVADKFDDLLGTRPPEQTEEVDEPQDEYEDDVQDTQEEEEPKK
jgi:hypothetical protein